MNTAALMWLAILVMVALVAWRRGARLISAGCTTVAVLPGWSLVSTAHPIALTGMVAVIAGAGWLRWGRSIATVTRWGASTRRKAGVASTLDVARVGSTIAMRRQAGIVRPSLRVDRVRDRAVQLLRLPAAEVAVQLCRVGGQRLWSSIQDVILMFGGPRTGKTQWLAGRIVDAAGAVLVTSTRLDLLTQTAPLRAVRGPVYVFNPVGLGLVKSTITFDPLMGCADPVVAHERAEDMIGAVNRAGGGDREFWDDQGRRNLAALLHAAALGGETMDDLQGWLSNLDKAKPRILQLLNERSPEPAFEAAVEQFIATNERTRTSITATIAPALGWLTHGPARTAATPVAKGGRPFDVATLLDERATVYLLGGEEAQVAPLVCALTGYIAREARRLAALRPGGRLDPPLSLRLDEAALICPVPLDRWTADMGGRGVSIVACFQSRAQLLDTYGEAKAAVILNNAGARVLFGGTGDRDDLNYWSTLAGERDEPITTTDMHGRVASRSTRRVPVLSPAQLANLRGRVVVFRRELAPVIGVAEQAWRRPDVRAVHDPGAPSVRLRRWVNDTRRAAGGCALDTWSATVATVIVSRRWIVARLRTARAALARGWTAVGARVTRFTAGGGR